MAGTGKKDVCGIFTVRIPRRDLEALRGKAQREERPIGQIIREALREGVPELRRRRP